MLLLQTMAQEKNKEMEKNESEKDNPDIANDAPLSTDESKVGSEEIQSKIAELESKNQELNNTYTRLFADFDNFRRRTAKERLEWLKTAGEDTMLAILPVLDDMERAVAHNKNSNDVASIREGIEVICQKFRNLISSRGVEPMETIGKPFDPELHDAITSLEAPDKDMKGKVMEEVQKGYLLNGKVIRHAKVVVGK